MKHCSRAQTPHTGGLGCCAMPRERKGLSAHTCRAVCRAPRSGSSQVGFAFSCFLCMVCVKSDFFRVCDLETEQLLNQTNCSSQSCRPFSVIHRREQLDFQTQKNFQLLTLFFATARTHPPYHPPTNTMSKRRADSGSLDPAADEDVDAVVTSFFERVEDFHEQRRMNKTTFTLNITRQIERNNMLDAVRTTIDTLDAVRGKDVVAEPRKKKSKTGVNTPSQKLTVSSLPFPLFLHSCLVFFQKAELCVYVLLRNALAVLCPCTCMCAPPHVYVCAHVPTCVWQILVKQGETIALKWRDGDFVQEGEVVDLNFDFNTPVEDMDDKALLYLIHTGNEVRKSAVAFQAHVAYRLGECVHGSMSWAKKNAKSVHGGSNAQQLFKDRIKQSKMFGLTKAYGLFDYYVLCSVYRESLLCLCLMPLCLSVFVVCVRAGAPR